MNAEYNELLRDIKKNRGLYTVLFITTALCFLFWIMPFLTLCEVPDNVFNFARKLKNIYTSIYLKIIMLCVWLITITIIFHIKSGKAARTKISVFLSLFVGQQYLYGMDAVFKYLWMFYAFVFTLLLIIIIFTGVSSIECFNPLILKLKTMSNKITEDRKKKRERIREKKIKAVQTARDDVKEKENKLKEEKERLDKERNKLEKKTNALNELKKMDDELASLNHRCSDAQKDLEAACAAYKTAQKNVQPFLNIKEIENEIKVNNRTMTALTDNLRRYELNGDNEKFNEYTVMLSNVTDENESLKKALEELKEEFNITDENESLKKTLEELTKETQDAGAAADKANDKLKEIEDEIKRLEENIKKEEGNKDKYRLEIRDAKKNIESFKHSLEAAGGELNQAKVFATALEIELGIDLEKPTDESEKNPDGGQKTAGPSFDDNADIQDN
jgi:predicted  nucleic acid-binding Zn-ribbon protein